MNEFFPDIAWRTILKEVKITAEEYYYTAKVSPEDPNEPGADPITVNTDCWIIDYAGYTYQITAISGNILTLYDVNKRKWGENFIGPTPNMEAYVYLPKNGAFLLTQAQLRYLDKSATDKIYPVEKGVSWGHRGVEIEGLFNENEEVSSEKNITRLHIEGARLVEEEIEEELIKGWKGGKSYKLNISSAPSEYLVKRVLKVNHELDDDFVYYNEFGWEKALATEGSTCATHFARKIDDDNFELIPVGELLIEGLLDENGDALVNGDYYFLSQAVEGKITGVKPEEGIIQSVLKVNAANTITISIQEPYDINDVGGDSIDLQLTTIGNEGAATLDLETGILNIPVYQEQLVSGTNIKTVNSTTLLGSGNLNVGTVTSVAALTLGTTGTDVNSSVVNGTTTPVITLNIPTASATKRGALSSADWTTFNNKQNTLVSGINIKTVAGNSLLGASNVINIRVSATEPTSIGAISGDIWIEP